MARTGETKYVDLQDDKELTVTQYLSEDLQKNWTRVWDTRAYNTEGRFHEGSAYTAAKKHLWYTGWVTLCGYPGDGRTCTAEHLVCNFVRGPWDYPTKEDSRWTYEHGRHGEWERKKYFSRSISEKDRERYTPVFVNSPSEYKSQLNPKENQIFVIDDIFGEACLNTTRVEQWRPHLEDIMMELTANMPKTLVIMCVNKAHLERLPELSRLDWFKPGIMIDFTDTHSLDNTDRKEQVSRNAGVQERMDEREMQKMGFFDVKEGAGLVYRIYSQIKSFKMEGPGFFRNPWKFIQDSIDKIYRFDKIFYYTIAVATLLDGKLDLSKQAVTEYDQRTQEVIRELIPLLEVPDHVNLSKMRFAAQQLTGFFFQPTDQFKWSVTHPKIYHLCVKSLYGRINKHLVRLASQSLLMNYIRTANCSEGQHELSIKVAKEGYEELAKKYIHEIMSGKMKLCIQSPCFGDADFVKVWFQQITAFGVKESILEQRDPILQRSLFYWACYYGHGYVVQAFHQFDPIICDEDWFLAEAKHGFYAACASNSPTAKIAVQCLLQEDAIGVSICKIFYMYEESTYGKIFPEELWYLMFLEAPTIHVAARFGHPDVVKLLLQKGVNHSVQTKDGLTPLHRAASRLDSAAEVVTDILIRQGASKDVKTYRGRKPINEAVACGNKRVVATLVNAGENVNGNMEDGQSLLSVAIQGHHKDLTDYLMMKGIVVNGSPEDNFTPLQHAIRNGNNDLADRLINNKDIEINKIAKAGMGALHVAVLHRDEQIVDKLIEKGADVNLQGAGNTTPLHMAARHGLYTMCDKLLKAMAKPELMTTKKETAVVLAAREGHKYVVWLLLQEGMELEGGVSDRLFMGGMLSEGIRGPLMERDYFRMFHLGRNK